MVTHTIKSYFILWITATFTTRTRPSYAILSHINNLLSLLPFLIHPLDTQDIIFYSLKITFIYCLKVNIKFIDELLLYIFYTINLYVYNSLYNIKLVRTWSVSMPASVFIQLYFQTVLNMVKNIVYSF